jgi:hypothetical protein
MSPEDGVGHSADQAVRDLGAIELGQVNLDLCRDAAGVQARYLPVVDIKPDPPLGD